ncbi:MAG: TolC family protein [Bdellovibrionota bacterium]
MSIRILQIGFSFSLLIFVPQIFAATTKTMDLTQFLQQVQDNNKSFKMNQSSKEAALDKKTAGDISLVPVLTFSGSYLSDKKQPVFTGGTETINTLYSLGLAKKFSTGTQIKLSGNLFEATGKDISNPAFASVFGQYSTGSLGLSFSQSLWKDAFGRGTGLRQKRETEVAELEVSAIDLQERQLLIEAESAFWDLIYLQQERRIRETSLQRAKRIETWVTKRTRDGIGDRADLMNAKALVVSRQMQLLSSQDDNLAAQKKLQDLLELNANEQVPTLVANLDQPRPLKESLKGAGEIIRLDSYLSVLEAKVKKLGSLEANDNLRSDLVLSGSYNTNSYENQGKISDAPKNIANTNTPTSVVSLTWTYLFDTKVKEAALNQVKKEAHAAELKSERKRIESNSSWSEIQRRYEELGKKIEAAKQIAEFQMERTKVQQDKLSKGRSITSEVITSEQEAAEAELTLSKLKVEQRKLEAQVRMFILLGEKI